MTILEKYVYKNVEKWFIGVSDYCQTCQTKYHFDQSPPIQASLFEMNLI